MTTASPLIIDEEPDMTTLLDDLRDSIKYLEQKAPESRLLRDYKEQFSAYEAAPGQSAEAMYYSGNPVVPTSPPATGENSASTPASNLPPLPDLNLPPEDPTVKDAVARRKAWLKDHPPEPISPKVEQLVRDLM
jgi:hypothetical protein